MVKGIGIDMAEISEITRLMENESFIRHTFTQMEQEVMKRQRCPAEYLASRFAVKEAVFKAVARLLPEKKFDFRIVETLNAEDGSPFVNINDRLQNILEIAGIVKLHVSITTEGNYAAAFVVAD